MSKWYKGFKLRRIYIYAIGAILLIGIGVIGLKLIDKKQRDLNYRILRDVSVESSLVIQKEFDILYQHVDMLNKLLLRNDYTLVDSLIPKDSIASKVVAAYLITNEKEGTLYKNFSLPFSLDIRTFTNNLPTDSASRFLQVGQSMYIIRHIQLSPDKSVYWFIDILKVNAYFWGSKLSARSYFEVYNDEGICVIHPDMAKVGKPNREKLQKLSAVKDSVIESSFIRMDVLARVYPLEGLLGQGKMIVSVLLMMTAEDVQEISQLTLGFGFGLICIAILMLQLLYSDRKKLQRVELDNLQYEKEKAVMRFENLREQMNPHFLFNSLGSLQQLIDKDNTVARSFVSKLARVYRKVLQSDRSGLSTVGSEIELAQSYSFLQEIRFGKASFSVVVDNLKVVELRKIPHLSLQVLVENAIKHNELSSEHPLLITIEYDGDALLVSNVVRPKTQAADAPKGGYGIAFLASVYQYYSVTGFYAQEEEGVFKVRLPLI
ncbi:histidine kinase [Sphingobacterium psychroaquaticum]|uniref:Histidine kinase n=1 Tax=Sphingobacterium psychroaquaticum TaxID=561061 RepID=A0A1X7K738_9SPHI|nr:histidine kinase [Sphingobacterium psychroaquaticum]SMG36094.1 Histidine kinase [Sphingobacterium psychroaquaticum]